MTTHPSQLAVAALFATLANGCTPNRQHSGVRIGDETLRQFEAGVTTEAWLLAILGKPTSESPVQGVETTTVLRYAITEYNSGLLSMFTGADRRTVAVVYFIVTDGTVTRFWADREIERTAILGKPVETTGGAKPRE